MAQSERFEFQSQAKEVLDLMVYSVYSNKDIFLRELLSNASDALDKLRFELLKNPELLGGATHEPEIRIDLDDTTRSVTISDNGIGMSRDEMIRYLGTIARSGTREFVQAIKGSAGESTTSDLIGQFGVGFYSAFMVAGRVQVLSRKAGEEEAHRWDSTGDGSFQMETAKRANQGTTITLFLKPQEEGLETDSYLQEWTIRDLVKRTSDFVAHPIRMEVDSYEPMEEGADPEQPPKKARKLETLNSMKALWVRPEKEVTDEEYQQFYEHLTRDSRAPLRRIVIKTEGAAEFRSVLFLPSRAPFNLYYREADHGIDLYIKRVFIMHDCKDLLPFYLRFVKGVVDSADLPLNISREILQKDRNTTLIRKNLVRKVLNALKDMKEKEPEKYLEFWKEFGPVLKEGLFEDNENRDALLDLILLDSTRDSKELTSLADYVTRMPEEQKELHYVTGRTRSTAENSPVLERFKNLNQEVLLLTHPVDELWLQSVHRYKDKPFKDASKGEVQIDGNDPESAKQHEGFLGWMKEQLHRDVKDVRVSGRLTRSPSCLVGDTFDLSPVLEQMLRATGQEVPEFKRILEVNPDHALVKRLSQWYQADVNDPRLPEMAELLLGQALLAEGNIPSDTTRFARLVEALMLRSEATEPLLPKEEPTKDEPPATEPPTVETP